MAEQDNHGPEVKAAILPVTAFQQNCTLLWTEEDRRASVIDPGGDLERIGELISEQEISVEQVILTHGHIDHAGGASEFAQTHDAPIIGPHKDDKFLLDSLEEQSQVWGLSGVRNCEPGRWLEEGDSVTIAGYDFAILHCPGHSPGSVVFFQDKLRLMISGDVIFQGSIGRTDLPGGDHDTLIASIKDKLFPLGDEISFICGHGPASTIGAERAGNPFLT